MIVRLGEAHHDGRGHVVIQRWHDYDDGTTEEGVFVIPEDALEWRAAEYHLDPTDLPSLLQIIIAECYVVSESEAPVLFTAPTIAEARDAHLEACRAVMKSHFPERSDTARLLPTTTHWHEFFVMNTEAIELKKQIVARHRAQARRTAAPAHNVHDERVGRLRRQLNHLTGGTP